MSSVFIVFPRLVCSFCLMVGDLSSFRLFYFMVCMIGMYLCVSVPSVCVCCGSFVRYVCIPSFVIAVMCCLVSSFCVGSGVSVVPCVGISFGRSLVSRSLGFVSSFAVYLFRSFVMSYGYLVISLVLQLFRSYVTSFFMYGCVSFFMYLFSPFIMQFVISLCWYVCVLYVVMSSVISCVSCVSSPCCYLYSSLVRSLCGQVVVQRLFYFVRPSFLSFVMYCFRYIVLYVCLS